MVTAGIAKVISYLGRPASAQMCRTEVQLGGTVCMQDPRFDLQDGKKRGDPQQKECLPRVQMFPHWVQWSFLCSKNEEWVNDFTTQSAHLKGIRNMIVWLDHICQFKISPFQLSVLIHQFIFGQLEIADTTYSSKIS